MTLVCWFRDHEHSDHEETKRCISLYQPGTEASRKMGCICVPGHRCLSCPVHGIKPREADHANDA